MRKFLIIYFFILEILVTVFFVFKEIDFKLYILLTMVSVGMILQQKFIEFIEKDKKNK